MYVNAVASYTWKGPQISDWVTLTAAHDNPNAYWAIF